MAIVVAAVLAAACSTGSEVEATRPESPSATTSSVLAESTTSTAAPAPPPTTPRPAWLGTRVLPVGPDGFGAVEPTPTELVDRRFATIDLLPPPTAPMFSADVGPVPTEVLARSTWSDACPIGIDGLRYVTLPFWGFDEQLHTGELLVSAEVVDAIVAGFGRLFDRRFPIEEMRITRVDELDAPPTGDGNNTSAFVCRPTRGSTSWSEHAYGRAVDINPFHNPYVKGDLVLPELASAYADRTTLRPGMLSAADVAGFTDAGWGWGGVWRSFQDIMHVSASGR